MRCLALAVVAMVAAPAVAEEVSDRARFNLWNDCGVVDLVVETPYGDAEAIGLRKADIETTVRSRLRGARIYNSGTEDTDMYLYVHISVVSSAFSLTVELKRLVALPHWSIPEGVAPLIGYASTWIAGSTGMHGGDPNFLLSGAAQYTDKFIDEYLRVNAAACQ